MAKPDIGPRPPAGNLRAEIKARQKLGYIDQRVGGVTICAKRSKRPKQLVYFIQHGDGPIKIGIAIDPEKRLRGMQTGHFAELNILVTTKGGLKRERAYHARFAAHFIRGEWFAPHPDILAEIERLKGMAA